MNYNYINKPKKRDKWDKTGLGGIMWDRKSEKEFQKLRGLNCPFFYAVCFDSARNSQFLSVSITRLACAVLSQASDSIVVMRLT